MKKATYHGHDKVSAQMASEIMTRMRFPTAITEKVVNAIGNHMKAHDMAKAKRADSIRRFMGNPNIELVEQLVTADEKATVHLRVGEEVKFADVRKRAIEQWPEMLPAQIITGKDLIAAGEKPGPSFEFALKRTFDRQLNGMTDRKDLLASAQGFITQWNYMNK